MAIMYEEVIKSLPMSKTRREPLPVMPGKIYAELWILCGRCGESHPLACEKNGREAAREQGWVYTKPYHWICPDCAEIG